MKRTYCDVCGREHPDIGTFKAEWKHPAGQAEGEYDACKPCILDIVAQLKGQRRPPEAA